MKKIIVLPVLLFFLWGSGQSHWKQSLHYYINVKFNPAEKSLEAVMDLHYINHSPDTLSYIWIHVWPNAYRNDRTSYTEQLLENGDNRFYFSSKDQKGYINRLEFRVNGRLANISDHPEYIDVIKLVLPKPLFPGDSIIINSSFHERLPYNFNGNGYRGRHFEIRNWYPEPAVYDSKGWHPMPFIVQGGAYHENADFDIEIESPVEYRIAAGSLADTLQKYSGRNLCRFQLQNANAFAWIADNRFLVKTKTIESHSGEKIRLQYFYLQGNPIPDDQIFSETNQEMMRLSENLMPYPHSDFSIVEASPMAHQNFSGLASIGISPDKHHWQNTLRQELASQWFQTIILTDQRNAPWISEGLIYFFCANPDTHLWLRVAENERTTQPILTSAPDFSVANDSLIASVKAALWLKQLKDSVGETIFKQNMEKFFSRWKFNHPDADDFKKTMNTSATANLKFVYDRLENNQSLFLEKKKTLAPAFVFSARKSDRYNYIGFAPVAGYNQYDGFMLGILFHNINLPANHFEFVLTPLYAFGSKAVEGLGRLSYSWHPENTFSNITLGINLGRFDTNKGTDSTGRVLYENFTKLVPYLRFDFKKSNARSTISSWMDFKTFLITEKSFDQFALSSKDSLIHPDSVLKSFRYVNQLSFNFQDSRSLYPYDLRLEFQQSDLFYRINLNANYFLNYPDGGGMQVRFFAAKFGVWNSGNLSEVSRYQPKLLGVNGGEDYLYEDYFLGRSASYAVENTSVTNGSLPAQQIMNRDGGLKLRIDAYDFLQGKSANWVTALNFTSTLPAALFPFHVPIRLFFDVGTYAEAWENNPPTNKFLYTGGIQLSLFRNVLNIYAPLIYSSDFSEALGNISFGRKITFSIDLQNIQYKKLIRKAAELE